MRDRAKKKNEESPNKNSINKLFEFYPSSFLLYGTKRIRKRIEYDE